MVTFESFAPFRSAEDALENINAVSEGVLHEYLKEFLSRVISSKDKKDKKKEKNKTKIQLGVSEEKLASSIQEKLDIGCIRNQLVLELLRGIRLHFTKFLKELKSSDFLKAQLGLAHGYSRSKIKFNINRADNHIIQAISLLDQLAKDINTFAMRVREWYSWHFPELAKITTDNIIFSKLALQIKSKSTLSENDLEAIEEIVQDSATAKEILDAARTSMGTDISEFDMQNIISFAKRVVSLDEYRRSLHEYLSGKMNAVAPNLGALVGEQVAARLISQAGSLTNLAKYPASTVQILGAEKALFRALKTRGNTPKYGIIFHSTFIGKATSRDKGRISRYLANKCSLASRIDSFSDVGTTIFGEKMREQVEDRLKFYETGTAPKKNTDVMHSAVEEYESKKPKDVAMSDESPKKSKKSKKEKKKKDKRQRSEDAMEEESPKKKSKKDKKKRKSEA